MDQRQPGAGAEAGVAEPPREALPGPGEGAVPAGPATGQREAGAQRPAPRREPEPGVPAEAAPPRAPAAVAVADAPVEPGAAPPPDSSPSRAGWERKADDGRCEPALGAAEAAASKDEADRAEAAAGVAAEGAPAAASAASPTTVPPADADGSQPPVAACSPADEAGAGRGGEVTSRAGGEVDGSGQVPVPPQVAGMVVTPALRAVLTWSEITETGGEDELEAYPLPGEDEAGIVGLPAPEPEAAEALAEAGASAGMAAGAADGAAAASVSALHAPPASPSAEATDVTALGPMPAAAPGGGAGAGGGGGGADDAAGPGGGAGSGGGRRRRRLFNWMDVVDRPMTIFEHLDELRRRLVWAVLAFVAGTAATFAVSQRVLDFTKAALPHYHARIILAAPMESLFAIIRIAAIGGLMLASPVILYEVVAYILPALTRKERQMLFSYLPATAVLFALGLSFGYFVFEPIALRVALTFIKGVEGYITLSNWVSFLMDYSLPFGLLFELPVVTVVLVKLGILAPDTLAKGRRFAIFGAVVVAAMFAPPGDFIFTPSLIALPIIALYEISIQCARVAYRSRERVLAQD